MKQTLQRLEKNHDTWFLLSCTFIFFFLRLPSLIEPYWYGDEGIYETIAKAMLHGRVLYTGIWDNKPPLLYVTYALFAGDQFSVRFFSLIVGLLSTLIFFILAKMIFAKRFSVYLATGLFVLLFATPFLEGNVANAENFMLLPILIAAVIVFRYKTAIAKKPHVFGWKSFIEPKQLFLAGLLLGIAFLYKVVAVFDACALGLFIVFQTAPEEISLANVFNKTLLLSVIQQIASYCSGFLLPFVLVTIYFFSIGAGSAYIMSIFSSNVSYVGYGNAFIIPQGFLILKLLLLIFGVVWLFKNRQSQNKTTLFVLLWFMFEAFDSFFSQRNYTHYMLMMLPSLSILIGMLFTQKLTLKFPIIIYIILLVYSFFYFSAYRYSLLLPYYKNYISYITNNESVDSYSSFFDTETVNIYLIADYLRLHTKAYEPVFVWGNSAQIYALSYTIPPGRYTVAYHITASQAAKDETEYAIMHNPPKFIVLIPDSPSLPFPIPNYHPTISLNKAVIYEKNH